MNGPWNFIRRVSWPHYCKGVGAKGRGASSQGFLGDAMVEQVPGKGNGGDGNCRGLQGTEGD